MRERESRRAERECAQLCTSQIYCCVSNFSRPTYLRGLLVKDSRGKGGGDAESGRERGPGRTLAKSEQAQRGRRLRGIDPTSICSLHTAIDHTGERRREPTHTVPSLSGIKSTTYPSRTRSHTRYDLVYDLTSLITPQARTVKMCESSVSCEMNMSIFVLNSVTQINLSYKVDFSWVECCLGT